MTPTSRAAEEAAAYARVAATVGRGEWTTYGDISMAIRGNTTGARAVGRAAAGLPDFPNAQRVLRQGGQIHPGWLDDSGGGPDQCRRLLESEGVRFWAGRADPACRVSWVELRLRDRGSRNSE